MSKKTSKTTGEEMQDRMEQYDAYAARISGTSATPWPGAELPCPHCGYCPHCGRREFPVIRPYITW